MGWNWQLLHPFASTWPNPSSWYSTRWWDRLAPFLKRHWGCLRRCFHCLKGVSYPFDAFFPWTRREGGKKTACVEMTHGESKCACHPWVESQIWEAALEQWSESDKRQWCRLSSSHSHPFQFKCAPSFFSLIVSLQFFLPFTSSRSPCPVCFLFFLPFRSLPLYSMAHPLFFSLWMSLSTISRRRLFSSRSCIGVYFSQSRVPKMTTRTKWFKIRFEALALTSFFDRHSSLLVKTSANWTQGWRRSQSKIQNKTRQSACHSGEVEVGLHGMPGAVLLTTPFLGSRPPFLHFLTPQSSLATWKE